RSRLLDPCVAAVTSSGGLLTRRSGWRTLGREATASGENGPTSKACGTTPAAWVLQPRFDAARRSRKARVKGSGCNEKTKKKFFDRDTPCLDIRGHLRVRPDCRPRPAALRPLFIPRRVIHPGNRDVVGAYRFALRPLSGAGGAQLIAWCVVIH